MQCRIADEWTNPSRKRFQKAAERILKMLLEKMVKTPKQNKNRSKQVHFPNTPRVKAYNFIATWQIKEWHPVKARASSD